jgi:HTH-type transcriptional regulator/antitoxin HipB
MRSAGEIGDAIRSRRVELDLTQEQVAFVAGVNRRVLGELEGGKPTVQLEIVLRVLAALGLELDLAART